MQSLTESEATAIASNINVFLGVTDPAPGHANANNSYFAGYGCRWCKYSEAFFTFVPFAQRRFAEAVARIFETAGAEVSVGDEAGLDESMGGKGIQVSAYLSPARDFIPRAITDSVARVEAPPSQ